MAFSILLISFLSLCWLNPVTLLALFYLCATVSSYAQIYTTTHLCLSLRWWYTLNNNIYNIYSWSYVPALTVNTSILPPTGPFTAGQSYTLTCTANVTGGETLSTTTTITWIHPSGSVTSGTGSFLVLTLNLLQVSDAGLYTCNVSVSSPFLNGAQSSTDTFTVNVQSKWIPNKVDKCHYCNIYV